MCLPPVASNGPTTSSKSPKWALWPRNLFRYHDHLHSIEGFFEDTGSGQLPPVTLVTPDIVLASEGEYQDDQIGESFTAKVSTPCQQVRSGTAPSSSWVWDEGGGFYDHVPPPPAVPPDDVPPDITVPPDEPGGYDRYGFRVPCLVASPYSKPGHVSSVVYDHTSILATLQRKWNLPALTQRGAAANPLLDFVDLTSPPTFSDPPALPQPAIWPFTGHR
jgi:phospholipase C